MEEASQEHAACRRSQLEESQTACVGCAFPILPVRCAGSDGVVCRFSPHAYPAPWGNGAGAPCLDDTQITDVVCRKRNLNSDIRVENPSGVLAEGFSRGNEFLYIVVEDAPDQEVIS